MVTKKDKNEQRLAAMHVYAERFPVPLSVPDLRFTALTRTSARRSSTMQRV